MAGVSQYIKEGPQTFVPADNATIRGGDVLAPATGGRVQRAGANSVLALGVAATDAVAPEDVVNTPGTDGLGRPVLAVAPIPTTVAVLAGGVVTKCTYAADAAFGDYLKCAANGQVTPATADGDPRLIIGRCVEPGGVTVSANARGLTRITL